MSTPTTLRPLMVLRLFAGRGAFRLASQAMAVVLAVVWGAGRYGQFANALGVCAWLAFVPSAAEKAALKILPRTRRLTRDVARTTVRLAVVPVLAAVAALTVVVVAAPGSTAALYLAAAAWFTGTGALMAVSGLHRFRDRPDLDATAFGVATAVVVAVTAVTWLTGLPPAWHALLLVLGLLPVVARSALALPRQWRLGRGERRLLPAFGRSTVLLGATEALDALALAAVFLVLAGSGRVVDSGPFYLAVLLSSVVCSFVLYLFRLNQPATSARLRGPGGVAGRARAGRVLRWVELTGAAVAVCAVPVVLLTDVGEIAAAGSGPAALVVLAVLVAVEIGLAVAGMYATYLLENTTGAVLAITASASVAKLAVAVVAAVALVPAYGAAGGFGALILSLAAHAALLRRLVLRHRPLPSPRSGARPQPAPKSRRWEQQ